MAGGHGLSSAHRILVLLHISSIGNSRVGGGGGLSCGLSRGPHSGLQMVFPGLLGQAPIPAWEQGLGVPSFCQASLAPQPSGCCALMVSRALGCLAWGRWAFLKLRRVS